jgi:alpha-tubulin suppressor-like RCC1 family protein
MACAPDPPPAVTEASADTQAVLRQPTTRALSVSVGGDGNLSRSFACGVNSLGAALCWGENQQLGIGVGDTNKRSTPTPIPGLGSGVASVSVGGSHACALTTRGAVKCWGNAGYYHLFEWDGSLSFEGGGIFDGSQDLGVSVGIGDGTNSTRLLPTQVTGLTTGVVEVAAGPRHTCALLATGGVKCWGHNNAGELGDGSNEVRLTPVDVSRTILTSAASGIAVGEYQSCAITGSRREVTCWGAGYDDSGALARNLVVRNTFAGPVRSIATSPSASCALLESGQVYCWGNIPTILPGEQYQALISRILDLSDPYNPVLTTTELSPDESALRERVLTTYPFWTNHAIEVQGLPAGLTALTMSRAFPYSGGLQSVDYTNSVISAAGGGRQVYWGQSYECDEVNEYFPRALVCPPGRGASPQRDPYTNGPALGLRTEVLRAEPVSIAVSYAAGGFTGCTTYASGEADCIGYGYFGTLGDGTLGEGRSRVAGARRLVVGWDPGLATRPLNNVAKLGDNCAVTQSGALRCWGRRYAFAEPIDGQTSRVTQTVGNCALTASGRVECWRDTDATFGAALDIGLGDVAQLGSLCVLRSAQAPALPTLACSRTVDPADVGYSCDGAWCPGALADGDLIDVPTDGYEIVALVAGQGEDHVRTRAGEWFAVSPDSSGGYRLESLAALGTDLVAVDGGSSLRCGLSALGQVRCIAREYVYDFALQTSDLRTSTFDIAGLPANPRTLTVASGRGCVVASDGTLGCWRFRSNTVIELPGGDLIFIPDPPGGPQLVATPSQTPAGFTDRYQSVSIGGDFELGSNICALTTSGQVKCAGRNERGQLGDRTYADRTDSQLVFAR